METIAVRARGLTFPALSCGEGPLVLCLHGFPDCLRSFHLMLPALAAAGFRAVAPALRGYAPGCQTDLRDTHVLAAAQDAIAIADALTEGPAHIVGHDWGAIATYLALAIDPSRFKSAVTLAVPHPMGIAQSIPRMPQQLRASWYMFFFQLRGVAERAIRARDFALIDRLWRDWSPSFALPVAEHDALLATFREAGVVEAALAYYRDLLNPLSPSMGKARALLARPLETPLLALTGAQDGCLLSKLYDHAMGPRWLSDCTIERMEGVGHFMHQEDPVRVNERIVLFLREHS